MCLIKSDHSKWRIAKKDIKVYKILYINRIGTLKSPYYTYTYNFGKIYPQGKLDERISYIFGGCLHSYTTFKKADYHLSYYEVLMECVIPKGTKYLIGEDSECVSMALNVESVVKYGHKLQSELIKRFEKRYNIVWS